MSYVINLVFLIKPFFQDKKVNILRMKRAFKVKQKAFFMNFKELSLKQIIF